MRDLTVRPKNIIILYLRFRNCFDWRSKIFSNKFVIIYKMTIQDIILKMITFNILQLTFVQLCFHIRSIFGS